MARPTKRTNHPLPPPAVTVAFGTPQEVFATLERVARMVVAGQLEARTANTVILAANTTLRALEAAAEARKAEDAARAKEAARLAAEKARAAWEASPVGKMHQEADAAAELELAKMQLNVWA